MKDPSQQKPQLRWKNYSTEGREPSTSITIPKISNSWLRIFAVWWSQKRMQGWRGKVLLAVFPGIFVALFLNIFQPFTVNNQDGSWAFSLLIAGYGLLATLIILVTEFLIRPMSTRWLGMKEVGLTEDIFWYSWHFLTVAIGMMLYRTFICYGTVIWPPISEVLTMIYRTFMIGCIPMILMLLGKKLYRQQALIQNLDGRAFDQDKLLISGENGKEQLLLEPGQLLFIISSDNYVEVYYQQDEKYKKLILRSSLTRIQDLLVTHPRIIRCHRSFIVNLEKIVLCEARGKGLQLTLEGKENPIPVSSKYKGIVLQLVGRSNIPV